MRRISPWLGCALVALAACGGKASPPKAPREQSAEEQQAYAVSLRKRMCACTDGSCASALTQELSTWSDERTKQSHDVEEALRPDVLTALACSDVLAGPEAPVVRLESFRQRACACRDAPCGTAAMADMNLWSHGPGIQTVLDAPPTPVLATRTSVAVTTFRDCVNRAMTALP